MQAYPNYSQMNNPYAQMNNMYAQPNNPYADRMNFLQNYQQSLQQPMSQTSMPGANQQMNVIGKIVDSIDVVKATDGSGGDVIYKQYTLKENVSMLVPKNPSVNGYRFDGWMLDGTNTVLSSSNIQALSIDKDYKFVAKMTKL